MAQLFHGDDFGGNPGPGLAGAPEFGNLVPFNRGVAVMEIGGGIKSELYMVGLKVARDSQLAVLSVVGAGLENMKQIAAQAAAPTGPGVGGKVDTTA